MGLPSQCQLWKTVWPGGLIIWPFTTMKIRCVEYKSCQNTCLGSRFCQMLTKPGKKSKDLTKVGWNFTKFGRARIMTFSLERVDIFVTVNFTLILLDQANPFRSSRRRRILFFFVFFEMCWRWTKWPTSSCNEISISSKDSSYLLPSCLSDE